MKRLRDAQHPREQVQALLEQAQRQYGSNLFRSEDVSTERLYESDWAARLNPYNRAPFVRASTQAPATPEGPRPTVEHAPSSAAAMLAAPTPARTLAPEMGVPQQGFQSLPGAFGQPASSSAPADVTPISPNGKDGTYVIQVKQDRRGPRGAQETVGWYASHPALPGNPRPNLPGEGPPSARYSWAKIGSGRGKESQRSAANEEKTRRWRTRQMTCESS